MKTFVIGDIHGANKALVQCLERSNFNNEEDTLIQLGDICDGWNEVYECVETLLGINKLIAIRGNHDDLFKEFINTNYHPFTWGQGGVGTLQSYCKNLNKEYNIKISGINTSLKNYDIPDIHKDFLLKNNSLII